jgi:hypothetical protein
MLGCIMRSKMRLSPGERATNPALLHAAKLVSSHRANSISGPERQRVQTSRRIHRVITPDLGMRLGPDANATVMWRRQMADRVAIVRRGTQSASPTSGWRSLVSRQPHKLESAGSNPAPGTISGENKRSEPLIEVRQRSSVNLTWRTPETISAQQYETARASDILDNAALVHGKNPRPGLQLSPSVGIHTPTIKNARLAQRTPRVLLGPEIWPNLFSMRVSRHEACESPRRLRCETEPARSSFPDRMGITVIATPQPAGRFSVTRLSPAGRFIFL